MLKLRIVENMMTQSALTRQLSTLFFLTLTLQNVYADCADRYLRCRDGTDVKLNYKYVWLEARCQPMRSGGGDSLDVVITKCQAHDGIDADGLPKGYGWTEFLKEAATLGFQIFQLYQETQDGRSPPNSKPAPRPVSAPKQVSAPIPGSNAQSTTNRNSTAWDNIKDTTPAKDDDTGDDELNALLKDLNATSVSR